MADEYRIPIMTKDVLDGFVGLKRLFPSRKVVVFARDKSDAEAKKQYLHLRFGVQTLVDPELFLYGGKIGMTTFLVDRCELQRLHSDPLIYEAQTLEDAKDIISSSQGQVSQRNRHSDERGR